MEGEPITLDLDDIPPSPYQPYENPLAGVDGPGSFLWMSDLHAPFHHAEFMRQCIEVAAAWKTPDAVIGGDLLDCANFSKYPTNPENNLEAELEAGEGILIALGKVFARIFYILGNHEVRMLGKTLNRQVRVERFIRMIAPTAVLDKIQATPFEWMEMSSPTGVWLLAHPKNSSVIAGRVPVIIAGRSATGKHLIAGHGHLRALAWADDGKRWAIDSGCCIDPRLCEYAVVSVSNRPAMMVGAVIVHEGIPTMLYPEMDWEATKRMHASTAQHLAKPRGRRKRLI